MTESLKSPLESPNSSISAVAKNLSSEDEPEPLTFTECTDLAKAVRYCSDQLIQGSWSEEQTVRGKSQIFTPANFDSAKNFLRASVESIHNRRKSQSLPDTPLTSRTRPQSRMPTCHGCHGSMGQGQHQGSAPGKDLCSLPHSVYCRGGVIEDASWRACPRGYQYNTNLDIANGTGFENTLGTQDFQLSQGLQNGLVYSTPVVTNSSILNSVSTALPPSPGFLEQSRLGAISRHRDDRLPGRVTFSDPSAAPRLPPRTIQSTCASGNLPVTNERVNGAVGGTDLLVHHQIPASIQTGIDIHRASNQIENETSNRPMGMTIGDLRRNEILRTSVENYVDTVIRKNIPSLGPHPTAPISISASVAPHPLPPTATSATVVTTISGQHQGPLPVQPDPNPQYLRTQQVQGPNHPPQVQQSTGLQQHQPPVWPQGPVPHSTVTYRTEFRCSPTTGRQWQVQVPITTPPQPAPVPQFRTEWRIHPFAGTPYQVQVPVLSQQVVEQPPSFQHLQHHQISPPQGCNHKEPIQQVQSLQQPTSLQQQQVPPQLAPNLHTFPQHIRRESQQHPQYEWRIDPHTGTPYQVQVPASTYPCQAQQQLFSQVHTPRSQVLTQVATQAIHPHSVPAQGQLPQMQQPPVPHAQQAHHSGQYQGDYSQDMSRVQQSFSQCCDLQDHPASLSRQDRVAGIVSLLEGGGGTTRQPSKVIDFAKKCPVKWSKQATMATINLPLYAWGAVAELEASLSGRSEAMQEGVLLGKLRHLQNILEVCCLSCSSTDFVGYSWTLARDYASKVDNEVEQKLASWQGMQAGVRTATLVSAQMEHPRPVGVKDPKKLEKKDVCTTYNRCKTEGKCEYEVSHPGKSCQRKHECSYCKEKKKQSFKHQAWNCQTKLAAEG